MGLKETEGWNNAYGLSKIFLRNFVVGAFVITLLALFYSEKRRSFAERELSRYKDKMYENQEIKNKKMDSILYEFFKVKAQIEMYENSTKK